MAAALLLVLLLNCAAALAPLRPSSASVVHSSLVYLHPYAPLLQYLPPPNPLCPALLSALPPLRHSPFPMPSPSSMSLLLYDPLHYRPLPIPLCPALLYAIPLLSPHPYQPPTPMSTLPCVRPPPHRPSCGLCPYSAMPLSSVFLLQLSNVPHPRPSSSRIFLKMDFEGSFNTQYVPAVVGMCCGV